MSPQRLCNGLCNGVVVALATWTVAANATVFLGGGIDVLLGSAVVAFAALALARSALRRRAEAQPEPATSEAPEPGPGRPVRIAAGATAVLIVGAYAATESTTLLWAGMLVLGAIAWVVDARRTPDWPSPAAGRADGLLLVLLCAVCLVGTVLANRPDRDDAFYVNLAVWAVDHPREPLIARDTLHGVPDVPLALPVYRVHSIELLSAAASRITGLPVLHFAHVVWPALFSLLVPLSFARLCRLLVPDRWLACTAAALLFLLCAGESHFAYGNFALTRLHQGKVVFLVVLLPLLLAYALEFARAPDLRRWLRLAAVQIAAVGCSASALWIAPSAAGLALLAATPLRFDRAGGLATLRVLATGVLASGYVLALGLALRPGVEAAFRDAAIALPSTALPGATLVHEALRQVIGVGPFGAATLLGVLAAWPLATTTALRRFTAVFLFAFGLVFANPALASWLATHVTGAPTHWRVLWLLPAPLLVATSLTAALVWLRSPRAAGIAISTGLALALLVVSRETAFSAANGVRFPAAGWRVPAAEGAAARAIARHAEPGSVVLAAEDVASWLPVLHRHPTPLFTRKDYLPLLIPALGKEEVTRRLNLLRLASNRSIPPRAAELLGHAIVQDDLRVVCLVESVSRRAGLRETLFAAGFAPAEGEGRVEGYEIWVRTAP